MSVVPPGVVIDRLRCLDHGSLVSFVARLWTAAGWETTVEGAVVGARRNGTHRRLLVVPARRFQRLRRVPDYDGPVDAVVIPVSGANGASRPRGTPAVPVLDADDLRSRLCYGVDRTVAESICERYLDVPLVDDRWTDGPAVDHGVEDATGDGGHANRTGDPGAPGDPSTGPSDADFGTVLTAGRRLWAERHAVLAGLMLCAVLAGAAFGLLTGAQFGGPGADRGAVGGGTPIEYAAVTGVEEPSSPLARPGDDRDPLEVPADCAYGARETLELQLLSFQEGGLDGIQGAWRFTEPAARVDSPLGYNKLVRSGEYGPLINAEVVRIVALDRADDTVTAHVRTINEHGVSERYRFVIEERRHRGEDCWRTTEFEWLTDSGDDFEWPTDDDETVTIPDEHDDPTNRTAGGVTGHTTDGTEVGGQTTTVDDGEDVGDGDRPDAGDEDGTDPDDGNEDDGTNANEGERDGLDDSEGEHEADGGSDDHDSDDSGSDDGDRPG